MSDNNGSYDFLPVEIANNILLRLPTKSIITCICVCKTWKSIIQNPTFISTHLHLSINNNNKHHLLFRFGSWTRESYALHKDDDDDCTQHTRFAFPLLVPELGPLNGLSSLVGTCNGLICFFNELSSYEIDTFFLWNPCVRRFVILPSPNVTLRTHGELVRFIGFGFGFDAKTKDYKVVRLVTHWDNPKFPKDRPVVEVYSLATGEWRLVSALPPLCTLIDGFEHTSFYFEPQRFVNGALHWLAYHYTDCFILAFDLGDEVFRKILLPEDPIPSHYPYASVSGYGDSIVFCHSMSYSLDIWVMKEYGVASSWTKVFSIPDPLRPGEYIPRPRGFSRNGEVVLIVGDKWKLASMDLENQKMKDLGIDSSMFSFVGSYVESLVLLDKPANVAVTY